MKKLLIRTQLVFSFCKHFLPQRNQIRKGGIDVVSNVYFDVSKNLNNIQSFHLSSLNYSGDSIIERIPDVDAPEITQQIYFIKDSLCYTIENENPGKIILSDIIKKQKPLSVEKEKRKEHCFLRKKSPITETEKI